MPRTGTRPTTDRVRESMFNVLASRIDFAGASVLDLYAGSGALGLEAMSRGAASAVFVESDHRAAAVIDQNIASLGVAAAVRRGPVAAVLAGGADRPADLVFADPPYDVADSRDRADAHRVGRREMGDRWHGGGCRARNVGAAAELARRLAALARPPLRRHPPGVGRIRCRRPRLGCGTEPP